MEPAPQPRPSRPWLNRTVAGVGLASLFSDWSHEIATAVLPAFLATLGSAAAWLGLIEGIADGISSFAKMLSGYWTDRLPRRKPIAVAGYALTAAGTAAFGLASAAWHVLVARSAAWLGRGVRTPVRKAILSGAVDRETYGRAFGFERMMDTLGAIVGPATAFLLIKYGKLGYPALFGWTLLPGLAAAAMMAFVVAEKDRKPVPHSSFAHSLQALPAPYRRFLFGVGLFGMGDFAHTFLILFATQELTPALGRTEAAAWAVGFYILHNVFYAGCSYAAGLLADRMDKKRLLAAGYFLAGVMAAAMMGAPARPAVLAAVFILGGIYVAVEETLEDSFCAELAPEASHGMAFGVLATVNGVGDMVSSVAVGFLWTQWGAPAAFGYSLVLSVLGGLLVLRTR